MELSCPVSAERVNENVIRIIAAMVVLIAIYSILYVSFYAILFLTVDFATRAFTSGKFSLLKFIALKIANGLSLANKPTDLAPKKFAATLGFVFCVVICLCYLLKFVYAAIALTIVMLVFAILESVFAICVGCYVYSFWQSVFKR